MEIRIKTKDDQSLIDTLCDENQCVVTDGLCLLAIENGELKGIGNLIRFEELDIISENDEAIALLKAAGRKLCFKELRYADEVYRVNMPYHFNTYDEVAAFIASQKSRVYSLDHFKRFMNSYFDIQYGLNCVHIGGTNGKGSTTNYTKQVLMTAGYQVGTFTSPALEKRLEIIKVNDEAISEEMMVAICNRFIDEWVANELSIFEIEMFIAVYYFLLKGIDIALFEVGLGGTLDATNIIRPILAVNTNIGLDHIDYLGDSYESIAMNKAGIIKDRVDYMTGDTRAECLEVFKKVADEHHSQLIVIDHPDSYEITDDGIDYMYHDHHIHLNTLAAYQVDNSALAINILEYIRDLYPFTEEELLKGLNDAFWAGRFEKVSEHPLIYLDGAHNREGMLAFYESAKHFKHPHIIFSALRDKDTHHMMEILCRLSDHVTVTQFDHYRAQTAELLAEDFDVEIDPDWHHAIDHALKNDDIILITGSLYFISQVRPYLKSRLNYQ